jgi:hypothetical protein
VIGIISRDDQARAVQEFFELFKTPWEFYDAERRYDVVVATTYDIPEVDAGLLVVSRGAPTTLDTRNVLVPGRTWHGRGLLSCHSMSVPVYGELATFQPRGEAVPCLTTPEGDVAGLRFLRAGTPVIRLGYDVFDEVTRLLSAGQPPRHARVPTLDLHVDMLRGWILGAGLGLVEIPPSPSGSPFIACLTHDIDFAGLRHHRFDHTMWGFLYRATFGALCNYARGRLTASEVFRNWRAAAALPLVHLGWARDFWEPFSWYLQVERDLPATYFLIPFKGRAGERVTARHARRRAAAYDVDDLTYATPRLLEAGCELGVHGIDAWHDATKGVDEMRRVSALTTHPRTGIRIHWLLRDHANTVRALEQAGYDYDASLGYNDTVGYRNGTAQVFRPLEAQRLLELPLHIQDGALFFHRNLDLAYDDAWARCAELLGDRADLGGVLTVLWHDRSHAPERLWGGFYVRLVEALRSVDVWFATARDVVGWFRRRRAIRFERFDGADGSVRSRLRYDGDEISPPVTIRIHQAAGVVDVPWNGLTALGPESSAVSPLALAIVGSAR